MTSPQARRERAEELVRAWQDDWRSMPNDPTTTYFDDLVQRITAAFAQEAAQASAQARDLRLSVSLCSACVPSGDRLSLCPRHTAVLRAASPPGGEMG